MRRILCLGGVAGILCFGMGLRGQNAAELGVARVGAGFARPIFVTAPAEDTNRLFVVEQHSGRIRVLNLASGQAEGTPFLTVSNLTRGSEQGLLGLAFHPQYMSNGFFYVNYTTTGGGPAGHTEVTRYRVQGEPLTSNLADASSKTVILSFPQPEQNHNGGWLGFGLDGFLYISTGDGGGGDDRHGAIGNGQSLTTLLGKILRIDVDQGSPYSTPDSNPFLGAADRREEIWAFGLRNPWRCSIDRSTGDLWIGDVGQTMREEIDFNPAGVGGLNFGWRPREGAIQNPTFPNETPVTSATDPVHDYGRSNGYSVTGGYVYRGQAIPALQGAYLFADYGTARFWSFRSDGTNKLDFRERTVEINAGRPRPIGNVSSFGEDPSGELYICDLDDGEIYKLISAAPPALTLSNPSVSDGVFSFQFAPSPGRNYVVEFSELATSAGWQMLTNLTGASGAAPAVVTDPVSTSQRFYRVRSPSD